MGEKEKLFHLLLMIAVVAMLIVGCQGAQLEDVMAEDKTEDATEEEEPLLLAHYMSQPPTEYALYKVTPVVRGIYVSAARAGSEEYLPDLIDLCNASPANAMVIDVRTEQGIVTFKNGIPLADEMGISQNLISDIRGLLDRLHDEGIYTIARVVAFKDELNGETRPELYIKEQDGSFWRDPQKVTWLNPYNRDSWDFVLSFAKSAAELGFKEIQFDYIRFAASQRLENADFGDTGGLSRTEIINEFIKYAMEQLKPYGVVVSADVYGTIINSNVDAAIVGQDYTEMAKLLDVICPMVYPSHYADNSMGIDYPDTKPYDTIYQSMLLSEERLAQIPEGEHRAIVRPWLQDFTASWLSQYITYSPEERWAQISAVYDAGLSEWLLWDAGVRYEKEGMTPDSITAE